MSISSNFEDHILATLLSATTSSAAGETPPLAIQTTSFAGRGLVATKSIGKDQVIHKEAPLVCGTPFKVTGITCVKCCSKLELNDYSECPSCGMYSCSLSNETRCSSLPNFHSERECRLLSTMSKRDRSGFRQKPGWLSLVRCVTLQDEACRGFQLLQDFTDEPGYADMKAENIQTVQEIVRHLPEVLNLTDKDQMVRSLGVMDANSFRQGDCRRLLFGVMSMANHDCCPNARVMFDSNLHAVLLAKCDIKEGDPVTIAYCSALKGTQDRRSTLLKNKLFECACARCSDPTEFGSHLSTLKCPKCKKDTVLPIDSRWECSEKENCGKFSTTDANVRKLLSAINKDNGDEPVKNLEKWLANVKHQRLGENHALVLDMEATISTKYNRVRTLASFGRQLELLKHREEVLRIVDQGRSSRLAGFLAFKRHSLLIEIATATQKAKKPLDPRLGQEIADSLQSAAQVLLDDADCPKDLRDTMKFFHGKQQMSSQ